MNQERLSKAWAAARARWPEIHIAQEGFIGRAEGLGIAEDATDAALTDLVLATACLGSEPAALETFEREIMPSAVAAIHRVEARGDRVDDVKQELRTRLFVGHDPRIGHYRARGDLSAWVMVAATRLAVDHERGQRRHTNIADALSRHFVESSREDPTMIVLRQTQQASLSSALRSACLRIDDRHRAILKMQFLDRMGIDRIASVYGVHRSTAARWVQGACAALRESVVEQLGHSSALNADEVRSLGRLLHSQLSISFDGLRATE